MKDAGPVEQENKGPGMIAKTFGPIALLIPLIAVLSGCKTAPPGEQAVNAMGQGAVLGEKGEHDRALQAFADAIRADPKSAMAVYGQGLAYLSKGDDEHALAD